MNRLPQPGFVPDLKTPVTTEEIIRMVKADPRGFKPNESSSVQQQKPAP